MSNEKRYQVEMTPRFGWEVVDTFTNTVMAWFMYEHAGKAYENASQLNQEVSK